MQYRKISIWVILKQRTSENYESLARLTTGQSACHEELLLEEIDFYAFRCYTSVDYPWIFLLS